MRDAVTEKIARAFRAANEALDEANGDTRTSCGTVAQELADAVRHIKAAEDWMRALKAEESADERRVVRKVAIRTELVSTWCAVCDTETKRDDVAICSGCDKPICPECMGDDGYCVACIAEEAGDPPRTGE